MVTREELRAAVTTILVALTDSDLTGPVHKALAPNSVNRVALLQEFSKTDKEMVERGEKGFKLVAQAKDLEKKMAKFKEDHPDASSSENRLVVSRMSLEIMRCHAQANEEFDKGTEAFNKLPGLWSKFGDGKPLTTGGPQQGKASSSN